MLVQITESVLGSTEQLNSLCFSIAITANHCYAHFFTDKARVRLNKTSSPPGIEPVLSYLDANSIHYLLDKHKVYFMISSNEIN